MNGIAVRLATNDNDVTTTGIDTIIVGDGDNRVLAGLSNDEVTSTNGVDVVLGDNGELTSSIMCWLMRLVQKHRLVVMTFSALGEGTNMLLQVAASILLRRYQVQILFLAITVSWFGRLQVLSKVLQLLI